MRKNFVCGFMFNSDHSAVVLIHKRRPDWQAGKWNGVGGGIEEGESAQQAMAREFEEEAGVMTAPHEWQWFAAYEDCRGTNVKFFMNSNQRALERARTTTDEEIGHFLVIDLFQTTPWEIHKPLPMVPNLPTLIGHAIGRALNPDLRVLWLPC